LHIGSTKHYLRNLAAKAINAASPDEPPVVVAEDDAEGVTPSAAWWYKRGFGLRATLEQLPRDIVHSLQRRDTNESEGQPPVWMIYSGDAGHYNLVMTATDLEIAAIMALSIYKREFSVIVERRAANHFYGESIGFGPNEQNKLKALRR
jgi:hypothetical protein